MKKYIKFMIVTLVTVICIGDVVGQNNEPRYIMFCDGSVTATSLGWRPFRDRMDAAGYNYHFSPWINVFHYDDALEQGVPALSEYLNNRIIDGNASNVFGISHCIGGLGLRLTQNVNSEISAMVLNGVPNQGSKMMTNLTRAAGSQPSAVERMVQGVEELTKADNCQDCGATKRFSDWVTLFRQDNSFLRYAADEGFADYGIPSAPYIIMYGLIPVSDFSVARMLDSALPNNLSIYSQCQEERRRLEIQFDNHKKQLETVRSTNNWLTILLSGAAGVFKLLKDKPDIGDALKAISDAVKASAAERMRVIERNFANDQETARRLRCILAQQLLEAEWLLLMSGDLQEIEEEVIEIDYYGYYQCLYACENDPQYQIGNDIFICIGDCYTDFINNGNTVTYTYYVYTPEPSDGLYTQSEMTLDGGPKRGEDIIFQNVDHFQETNPNVIRDLFFNQIYTGAYGPEFVVHKN
jgi:hypothetical protein